jgi:hypothetical protein
MTTSILQRIHSLADKPPSADACKAAASILRKLATDEGAVQKAAEEVIKSHGAKPRATQLKLVAEKATARLNIVQKATAKPPATGVSPTAAPSKPTSAEGQRAAGALELFEDLKNRM